MKDRASPVDVVRAVARIDPTAMGRVLRSSGTDSGQDRTSQDLSIADTGVRDGVCQIRQQIGDHNCQSSYQVYPHNERVVAAVDALQSVSGYPRPDENGFDNDRAAEQPRYFKSNKRNDRNQRIAQGVAKKDISLPEPLCPGYNDVVLPESHPKCSSEYSA